MGHTFDPGGRVDGTLYILLFGTEIKIIRQVNHILMTFMITFKTFMKLSTLV